MTLPLVRHGHARQLFQVSLNQEELERERKKLEKEKIEFEEKKKMEDMTKRWIEVL